MSSTHLLPSLLACLVSSYHLPVPCRPASLLVRRNAWRYASALFAIAAVVRMSCGGWLLAPRFAYVPPVSIAPLPRHG